MNRKTIAPSEMWDPKKYGFAHAILVEEGKKLLFLAGQNGIDKEGNIVGKDFELQCRKSYENVETIVRSAGGTKKNIVRVTAYVTDMKNADAFVKITTEFFGGEFTSQTLLQVGALAFPDLNVELEAIAVL
jgi:enamine deaminase RidA (YjgF/YER057c/UK114 family)